MAAKKFRTFTKNIDGEDVTLLAHSPAEEVQFVYDGWREITDDSPFELSTATTRKTAAAPAKADAKASDSKAG